MGTNSTPHGPTSLSALLDEAERSMEKRDTGRALADGFLFSGNRHESVPRSLILDQRLTPLERNAWQVFRILLNDDGITAFPTYEKLRPYLASMPLTSRASHETVARALTLLRLTRWLSLVRRRRSPRSGRIQGNLYVLHDEPLSPFEAMQIDPEYLDLVSQSLTHASKAVQLVGNQALQEISEDPMLKGRNLPTRLQVLVQRLASQGMGRLESYPQDEAAHESEAGQESPLRNEGILSSESEAGGKTASAGSLRIPKSDSTVRNSNKSIYKVRTVQELSENLHLPEYFSTLRDEQQRAALAALRQVDSALRQAVIDEWTVRCMSGDVRNPAGYIFGIIQKAIRGDFKVWVGDLLANTHVPAHSPSAASSAKASALGQEDSANQRSTHDHLAELRSLIDRPDQFFR